MAKTSVININVPTEVKEEANSILNSLGLNMSTAINIFLKKVIRERGIPFELKQEPNENIIESLKELDDIEHGRVEYKKFKNIESLLEDLHN